MNYASITVYLDYFSVINAFWDVGKFLKLVVCNRCVSGYVCVYVCEMSVNIHWALFKIVIKTVCVTCDATSVNHVGAYGMSSSYKTDCPETQ